MVQFFLTKLNVQRYEKKVEFTVPLRASTREQNPKDYEISDLHADPGHTSTLGYRSV